jgi:hypothetical protein
VKDDLKAVVALLRDPANANLYRERCSQAVSLKDKLESIARKVGIPIWRPRQPNLDPRTHVGVSFELGKFANDGIAQKYRAHISAHCLTDVFTVNYSATIANCAPEEMRLDPFLQVNSKISLIESMKPIEDVVIPELERTGRRRLARDELIEYCPGLRANASVDVGSALEFDINGWLSGEPDLDETPNSVLPHRAATFAIYAVGAEATVSAAARETPLWVGEIEGILHRGSDARLERLSPEIYPSTSWTVDFGEVRNGAFHARFFTDLHISKLAPVWYYTDRFTVAAVHPESLQRELNGWMIGEIGYLVSQTDLVKAVTTKLGELGFSYLMEPQLGFYVPGLPALAGQREAVMLSELLFRDVFGLCPPAPRIEEEHPFRPVRPRVGRLQGSVEH